MDFINIIGTIIDNSVEHVVTLAHMIKDLRLNKNLLEINEELYLRIELINAKLEKSKGYYSSLTALQQSIPNPTLGDWAIITYENKKTICVCNDDGIWTITDLEYSEELNLDEYVKLSELKTINNLSLIGTGNIEIHLTEGTDIPIENISSLESELQRCKNELNSIKQRLELLEFNNSTLYKYVLITLSNYNALLEYERNTLYLIIDSLDNASVFGSTFPFILGGEDNSNIDLFNFGETFPIKLN